MQTVINMEDIDLVYSCRGNDDILFKRSRCF